MKLKQYSPNMPRSVVTDGCFYMDLLDIGWSFANRVIGPVDEPTVQEVRRIYKWVIPDFMRDGGNTKKNRCFIEAGGHVEIIRAMVNICQIRDIKIEYRYRKDYDDMIIGKEYDYDRCNYFLHELDCESYTHFVHVDRDGQLLYNPGRSFSEKIISVRGFYLAIE